MTNVGSGIAWAGTGPAATFRVTDPTQMRAWPGKYVLYDQTQQRVTLKGRVFDSFDAAEDTRRDQGLERCVAVRLEGI
jgi:hypothetical protein